MILKIVGSLVVFLASVLAGLYYGNIETYRIGDLQEMKRAFSILKSEIEYAMNPLPEALLNIAMRTKQPVCNIFGAFNELIRAGTAHDAAEVWEACVLEYSKGSYLNREDVEHFILFGKSMGYLDKGMQLSNISITTQYIDAQMERLNKSRYKNKRLFSSFGVLGGLLIVIIFI